MRLPVKLNGAIIYSKERRCEEMKIVQLCREGSCCPVVKITESRVEIGEKGNTCILTKAQWETLKEKILKKEV
jgi:hypothetical protein